MKRFPKLLVDLILLVITMWIIVFVFELGGWVLQGWFQ